LLTPLTGDPSWYPGASAELSPESDEEVPQDDNDDEQKQQKTSEVIENDRFREIHRISFMINVRTLNFFFLTSFKDLLYRKSTMIAR
jgi:hypothetical protein